MPTERTSSASWQSISDKLRDALNAGTYGKWFGSASALEETDEVLVVGVPNEFTKSWIESHFGSLLGAAAAEHDLVVELRVAVAEAKAEAASAPITSPHRPTAVAGDLAQSTSRHPGSKLNPRYTFDLFVIGPSNRFAHAAALAVAESPAQAYNPLFIHGSTGLGKTHLLQAVGQYVRPAALRAERAICHNRDADERVCRRFAGEKGGRVQTAV